MKQAASTARRTLRGSAVGALIVVGALTAGTAGADPQTSPAAGLVNQIADVDQHLADLSSLVAAKQENVNKALVDFQSALAAQQVAAAADDAAQSALAKTQKQVEAAQQQFNDLMRLVNRQGNNLGTMTDYVSSSDPDKVLEKMTSVDQVARQQRATITRLQVVRNQQANRVAATTATKRQAQAAAKGAAGRRNAAIEAVNDARKAVDSEQTKRAGLLTQRAALTAKLNKLRGVPAPAPTPGDVLGDAAKKLPSIPAEGEAGDPLAQAADAVAKLAVDTGQQLLASLLGSTQIPQSDLLNELGIGGTSPGDAISRLGTGSLGSLFGGGGGLARPGLRGPQAVELVVNRAKSQLGMPYAWGGGDANGPTLGIRDGGVADSFGDYNKVGFDCSGLMVYAFAGIGIDLPHYTGYQYTAGPHYPLSQMQRGDMIFYGPNASEHVAMYLGDGTMIEAPQSGDVVKISPVRTDGAMPDVVRLT
ncbi:NlpC/P60 family protein [Gordonia sp. PP30]|uniref:NlpC/P60 family protein n=1 Tax=unclassified Gordonia (in: high G+C Gram-positive bacteria) TaxID=2657482 RepID=UPI001FFE5C01|nr:NlpC/P60 family protein [Gordonia sp. PP30]UQE76878.1 NlpC/P60 family protein [Gordonia sp. PP30]